MLSILDYHIRIVQITKVFRKKYPIIVHVQFVTRCQTLFSASKSVQPVIYPRYKLSTESAQECFVVLKAVAGRFDFPWSLIHWLIYNFCGVAPCIITFYAGIMKFTYETDIDQVQIMVDGSLQHTN